MGEVIPDCAAPKCDFLLLSNCYFTLSTGFVTRFQRNRNKWKSTTEVLPRRFNWKKIQPRILQKITFRRLCYILTFDPGKHAISKWCTRRKWHIPMASNRKKSRRRIWLTKWDKVKAHDTLIDWCTGREWPVNCMTVISAWWRSNMPFQRSSGRLSGRWTII